MKRPKGDKNCATTPPRQLFRLDFLRRRSSTRKKTVPRDLTAKSSTSPSDSHALSRVSSQSSQPVGSPISQLPNSHNNARIPKRVALQNDDTDENAIVVTTLDSVPFASPEDLLRMSRPQLADIAIFLNSKLPSVLQIDISDSRSDAFVRNSIELIVGIRQEAPPAPKASKLRTACDVDSFSLKRSYSSITPPSSPLAYRIRAPLNRTPHTPLLSTPTLGKLVEEDEPLDVIHHRAKRRRVSSHHPRPYDMADLTPTPATRIFSRPHPAPLHDASDAALPRRVVISEYRDLRFIPFHASCSSDTLEASVVSPRGTSTTTRVVTASFTDTKDKDVSTILVDTDAGVKIASHFRAMSMDVDSESQ